jgi:hypothetical protein
MFRTAILTTTALVLGSLAIATAAPAVANEPKGCSWEEMNYHYDMQDAQSFSERADQLHQEADGLRKQADQLDGKDQSSADYLRRQSDRLDLLAEDFEDLAIEYYKRAAKVLRCIQFGEPMPSQVINLPPPRVTVPDSEETGESAPPKAEEPAPDKPEAAEPRKTEAPKPEQSKPEKKAEKKSKSTGKKQTEKQPAEKSEKPSKVKKTAGTRKAKVRDQQYASADSEAAAALGNMVVQNLIGMGIQYGMSKQQMKLNRHRGEKVERAPRKHRRQKQRMTGDTTFTAYTFDQF